MDDNMINLDAKRIARIRNLKPYRGKTDEEIRAIFVQRQADGKTSKKNSAPKPTDYEIRFNEKMKILQDEYSIDMNNSNDAENLKALVRFQIQLENVDKEINSLQSQEKMSLTDYDHFKKLSDIQRQLVNSLTDMQDKLGISRKIRKEKAVDDIPQWIDGVLKKAKTFYDTQTTQITCPRCMIELMRYWLNFPEEKNELDFSLTCWKCKEVVIYTG